MIRAIAEEQNPTTVTSGRDTRAPDRGFANMRVPLLLIACILTGSLAAVAADDKGPGKSPAKKAAIKEAATSATPAELVWPMAPDPPRVRWLAEYVDLAKVKSPVVKKSGWLDKVTGAKTADEKMELRKPYGIATDSKGRIYAADTELKTVFVIDPRAKTVERREGDSRSPFGMPAGVAVDSEDRLFVSDAELHSITCFDRSGKVVAHFGTSVLGRPGGIAIDQRRNRLYVADAKQSHIAVFDIGTLQFVSYFGEPGKAGKRENGTFFGPTNVAVDRKGNLYVADTSNYRVQVLDANGKFLRTFGAQGDRPGEFIRPKGIAVDSQDHVYVADAEFNNFQILTSDGKPLLAVGSLGSKPGEFALAAGLCIDPQDRIYTTEMFRGRIQVFQYIPQPEILEARRPPTTVPAK